MNPEEFSVVQNGEPTETANTNTIAELKRLLDMIQTQGYRVVWLEDLL